MTERQDAIAIDDFVYGATQARVRRLTLPDGTHWFPAVDVAVHLGYANTRQALAWHVPSECSTSLQELAEGVYGADALRKLAGRRLQKAMRMVNVHGLVRLVNGCTKPEAEPFKRWVSEVVVTVQREGVYRLPERGPALPPGEAAAEPAAGPGAGPGPEPGAVAGGEPGVGRSVVHPMPRQVAEAIVRLEQHNLRLDEQWIAAQEDERRFRGESLALLRRIAEGVERMAEPGRRGPEAVPAGAPATDSEPEPEPGQGGAGVTAEGLVALWQRRNLAITADVWPVALLVAAQLAARGEARVCPGEVAARTGLSQARVLAALRLLLRHRCFRQCGTDAGGAYVYVLPGR
ncbi:BRO-N domain-containing protein [Streptomyces cacaoi]|uniref:BRO-N domain-containing protein n=1 Tax=Streptomyces cacaoi TaxID=1898 RepID=UPI00262890A7|nr:Bro-N domain-containing protein [Streptomyces cacaoi]